MQTNEATTFTPAQGKAMFKKNFHFKPEDLEESFTNLLSGLSDPEAYINKDVGLLAKFLKEYRDVHNEYGIS